MKEKLENECLSVIDFYKYEMIRLLPTVKTMMSGKDLTIFYNDEKLNIDVSQKSNHLICIEVKNNISKNTLNEIKFVADSIRYIFHKIDVINKN